MATLRNIAIILMIFFSSTTSVGQNLRHLHYVQQKADSLVTSFWGPNNFANHIKLDKKNSTYLLYRRMWDKRCSLSSKLTFAPNTYHYQYNIIHPAFGGDTPRIKFYLDSLGDIIIGYSKQSLFNCLDLDSFKTISKEQAILKAKEFGLPKGKDSWQVILEWREEPRITFKLQPHETFTDLFNGRFVWNVKSKLTKEYREGCFFYNKRVMSIDIETGLLLNDTDIGEGD